MSYPLARQHGVSTQAPQGAPAQTRLQRLWAHACIMGPADALRCALISLLHRARPDDSAFDRRHGTDTGVVLGVRFDEPPAPGQVVRSGPTPPAVIRSILSDLEPGPAALTFVDFGSGKGRALLCAAAFPFKRIIGVEWSTDLCAIARRNVEIFRARNASAPQIEVHCQNVLEYEMPPGPLLVYIFNPFGPKLTRAVLEKIGRHAQATRDTCLIAFAGVDDPQIEFVSECLRSAGLRIVRECRTLDIHSSWILAEPHRSLEASTAAPVGSDGARGSG